MLAKADKPLIFVINLESSRNRRLKMQNQLERFSLNYIIFPAVNGHELPPLEIERIQKNAVVKMSKGEIGAALSHLSLYQYIVAQNLDSAIIMEDDVEFDAPFVKFTNNFTDTEKKNFDILLLGYHLDNLSFYKSADISFWGRKKIAKTFFYGKPIHFYWGAYGYLITNQGARKILNLFSFPQMPADYLTGGAKEFGLTLRVVSKPIVWPSSENDKSTISLRGSIEPKSTSVKSYIDNRFLFKSIKSIFSFFQLMFLYERISLVNNKIKKKTSIFVEKVKI